MAAPAPLGVLRFLLCGPFVLALSSCDDFVAGEASGSPSDASSGTGDGGDEGSEDGEGGGDDGATDDTGVDPLCSQGYDLTWSNWASSFFATYCDSCHAASSPNRFGAPEYATFDTEQQVVDAWDSVYRTVIEDENMPLGGGVYDDDLFLIEIYLVCTL